jgi:two-component system cell cycle sensor histidine kinase/response regulator CckA
MPRTVREPGEALLTDIMSYLPVGVWVARAPSGEVVYVNPVFRSILGMDAVEGVTIQGAPATYGITDQAGNPYPVDRLPFSRVLATGQPAVVDDLVIDRGAKGRVNVRAFAAPIRDQAGTVTHIIVAFIDISSEARAIADSKKLQDQLRFAVSHAPVVLWATDRQGTITLSEGSALAGLGLASGQLVGQSVFDLYRDYPGALATVRRALEGEEASMVGELGGVVLETTMTPVRDHHGQATGLIGISTDVTERRRLQARMIQNDRVAALGTLAASVAHEINNPLTYLLGELASAQASLTVALEAGPGQSVADTLARARSSLAEARIGAERIGQIARELHTFARPAAEETRPVSLAAVIRSVLQLVRKEIEARARLRVEVGEPPPLALGDESRLVQVVLNLLVNAWQALPEAAPDRHRITVSARRQGDRAIIEVSDSGPGIPPENRERIFDPFFTTKEVGAGTGLGLFVCRNIVRGFGGQIEVDQGPDGGALFRVRLPIATAAPLATPAPVEAPPGRRERVLIIDDDERVARTLVALLSDEFEVRAVLDGREALELLVADRGLALAYCDLMMGGLTGMELHEALVRRAPDRVSRLVFMTGGAYTASASTFVQRMGDAVVYKPFDILSETRRRLAR